MKNFISPSKKHKNLSLLAVGTILALVIATQVIVQVIVTQQEQYAQVIQQVNHQTILSQTMIAQALTFEENSVSSDIMLLSETHQEWKDMYLLLQMEQVYESSSADTTVATHALFQQLQPYQDTLSNAVITLTNTQSSKDRRLQIAAIQRTKAPYLLLMEQLTEAFTQEAQQRVDQLKRISIGLGIFSLLALLIEYLWIFKPASRALIDNNQALVEAYQEQEALNQELTAVEEELRQALNAQTGISENLKKAKRKAEEASLAKAQFLSTMSHEIRTPMNAVIGLTNLLLDDHPRKNQLENLQALKFSGENLLVLINDILDLSKIEAGKIELEASEYSLRKLISSIQHTLGLNASEKGIYFRCSVNGEIPEVLVGDSTRLSQILNNLVSNAIKFTLTGGVELLAKLVAKTESEATLHFSVSDTGIGIPADKLPAIFDNFSQASADTTRKFGGTGLGLAITKKLLEMQGSAIRVESKVNQGSVFSFTLTVRLPTASQLPAKVAPQKSQPLSGLQGVRVLVAEDNQMNVVVIQQFLKKWGVTFDIVGNGQLAVEQVQQKVYDLVLMDLQMPVMDGFTAATHLKASHPQLPIIALTASAMLEVKDQVYAVGMDDFVPKPFVPRRTLPHHRKTRTERIGRVTRLS